MALQGHFLGGILQTAVHSVRKVLPSMGREKDGWEKNLWAMASKG